MALAAAALIGAALLWSGGTVLVRALRDTMPPMGLGFWRAVVALVLVLPFAAGALWRDRRLLWAEAPRLVVAGLCGVALFPVVFFLAVHNTEAINVGLVSASEPLVIALLAWLALGDRLGRGQIGGFVVGAAGVIVLVTKGEPARVIDLAIGPGDAFAVASLFVWGVYTVLVQRLPRALAPGAVLAAVFAAGLVFAAPFAVVEAATRPVVLTPASATVVLYSAAGGALLAFAFWNFGARVLGPTRAGFFLYLIPVFTFALAVALLGEPVRPYHGVGAAAIALGVAIATRAPPGRRRVPAGPP
ncbi:MAG: DMT family transporter [Alphaproteobacteria bacterium]